MRRIIHALLLTLTAGATGTLAESTTGGEENPTLLRDSIVVTADRFGLPEAKSVWPVSAINLKQTTPTDGSLQELLDGRFGLDLRESGGVGSLSTLTNWGLFNRHMLLLYDGRVVKDYSLGGFNLADYSADEFERIEVLKGPQSAFYGSDAVGGVVNLISRSAQVNRLELASRIGSLGLRTYELSASRRIGSIGLGLFAETSSVDNRRSNSGSERRLVGFHSGYLSPDGHHRFSFAARYFRDSLGVPGPLPDPAAIPVYGSADASSLRDRQQSENYSGDVSYRYNPARRLDFQIDLYWEKKNLDYNSLYNYSYQYPVVDSSVSPADTSWGLDSVDVHSLSVYNKRSAGISARALSDLGPLSVGGGVDWLSGSIRATSADLSNSTTVSGPFAPSAYSYSTYNYWSKAQDQYDLWATAAGESRSLVRIDLSGRVQLVHGRTAQPSFNTGLVLWPKGDYRVKLGYGYAFRLPTIAEQFAQDFYVVGNARLEPETARTLVATLESDLASGRVQVRLTAFAQRVKSLIQYVTEPVSYRLVPVNIARFKSDGLDASVSASITRTHRASLGLVYQQARQADRDGGLSLAAFYVPEIKWRFDLDGSATRWLDYGMAITYTSDRSNRMYDGSIKRLARVYEVSMNLSARFRRDIIVGLSGLDLTDRRRPDQFGYSPTDSDFPTLGRRFIVEMKLALR